MAEKEKPKKKAAPKKKVPAKKKQPSTNKVDVDTGRPTAYTEDLADLICASVSEGNSLKKTIQLYPQLPTIQTIFRWIRTYPQFCSNYDKAKEDQADMMVEEMLDIADDSSNDYISTDQGERVNSEAIARSRLRVDTRKWAASKFKQKKYGDKLQTDNTNHNLDYAELSDDELNAAIARLES